MNDSTHNSAAASVHAHLPVCSSQHLGCERPVLHQVGHPHTIAIRDAAADARAGQSFCPAVLLQSLQAGSCFLCSSIAAWSASMYSIGAQGVMAWGAEMALTRRLQSNAGHMVVHAPASNTTCTA